MTIFVKRIMLIVVLVFIALQPILGNGLPTSRLDFYQDYARFKANQGFGYLELYFAIPRDCFRYEMAGAEYRARMEINVRVFLNDTLVSSQSWKNRDEVDSLGVIKKGQIFYDLYSIYLKEGTYQIRTKVTDLIGLQEKEKILNVTMKSKFVKNGYKILPNPGGIYGTSMPVLYYYMEIYHLYPLTNALDSTYVVNIKYKDSEGKRNFLRNFWKKRDYNLMTPQNEFKDQYLNRVHLANQRYSSISREGWKTDRGRVLILYGEPDDIQRNSFSGQSKAYEIWWYHKVEGGVKFIFADESGDGEFKLVHSTARNEIHDYQWESRLRF